MRGARRTRVDITSPHRPAACVAPTSSACLECGTECTAWPSRSCRVYRDCVTETALLALLHRIGCISSSSDMTSTQQPTVAGRNARARTSLSQHDGRRSRRAPACAPCTHASTALTPPRHRTQSISALLTAWTNGNGTTSASTGQPHWASTRDIAQRFSDWANDSTSNIRCSESIEYSGIVEALKKMYDEQLRDLKMEEDDESLPFDEAKKRLLKKIKVPRSTRGSLLAKSSPRPKPTRHCS